MVRAIRSNTRTEDVTTEIQSIWVIKGPYRFGSTIIVGRKDSYKNLVGFFLFLSLLRHWTVQNIHLSYSYFHEYLKFHCVLLGHPFIGSFSFFLSFISFTFHVFVYCNSFGQRQTLHNLPLFTCTLPYFLNDLLLGNGTGLCGIYANWAEYGLYNFFSPLQFFPKK